MDKQSSNRGWLMLRNVALLASAVLMTLALSALLPGCARKVYVPMEAQTVIQTRYVERIDTVEVEVEVPAQSASNVTTDPASHLETDVAESDAWLDSLGRLHHTLANKPGKLPAQVPVKSHERDSIGWRDRPVPYPVERELSRWEAIKMDFGGFALGAVGVVVCVAVIWLIKKFRK